jgi:hypothetical protein
MSLRKTVRVLATGTFVLLLAPVVGDFFVEIARENGFYNNATAKVQAVVDWLQSIFGEQGFFWLLFGIGGLAAGLWLDVLLKRREPERPDPVVQMAERLGYFMGMTPGKGVEWGTLSPKGTTWQSELTALHLLMIKADFRVLPFDMLDDEEENLEVHRTNLGALQPYIETGQIREARMVSCIGVARMLGEIAPDEVIPVVERPTHFRRLIDAMKKNQSPPDIEPETQP